MKTTTTATAAYESPESWVNEISINEILCTSTPGLFEDEQEYEF